MDLILASRNGYVDIARGLINAGVDVDVKNELGWTPLTVASRYGHTDVVEMLIEAGANVNIQNMNDEETSLYLASLRGHVAVIKEAYVDVKNEHGWSALTVASRYGHTDIVEKLIEAGANVNVQNRDRDTALYLAAWGGFINTVRTLIKAGADVDAINRDGFTPICVASINDHTDTVEILIEAGADVNLEYGCGAPLYFASANGHINTVRTLIKAGAELETEDIGYSHTPLILASGNDHPDVVEMLIEAGANVNAQNIDGQTPLYLASEGGYINIVRTLIKAGADVNEKNKNGDTPLSTAMDFHTGIVELIVSHIAKLEAASFYVSEENLKNKSKFINTSYERCNNYLQHSQNSKEELKKLKRRNRSLYDFLTESNFDKLANIWKRNYDVCSIFNNKKELKEQYPEYAHILINKANKIIREIFLHNHGTLIDNLTMYYKCYTIETMTFAGIKNFFKAHNGDFKENLGNGGISLSSFLDFQDIKEKHIPTLKVLTFTEILKIQTRVVRNLG